MSPVEYLERAIASFEDDPPTNDYQRGYLAALVETLRAITETIH